MYMIVVLGNETHLLEGLERLGFLWFSFWHGKRGHDVYWCWDRKMFLKLCAVKTFIFLSSLLLHPTSWTQREISNWSRLSAGDRMAKWFWSRSGMTTKCTQWRSSKRRVSSHRIRWNAQRRRGGSWSRWHIRSVWRCVMHSKPRGNSIWCWIFSEGVLTAFHSEHAYINIS